MVYVNIQHLKSLDELQQKIHMDAMGISLGATMIGGIGYTLLDISEVISNHAEISFLIMLMGLSYLIAALIGQARYK